MGDVVTYVVNRNINFTNVCFVNCQFCAFKRQRWEEDAYTHGVDVVLGKVEEAIQRGATEVCMQGGINPHMEPFTYRDILVAIKTRYPRIHVHAFSPMEIMYGARRTGMDYPSYIAHAPRRAASAASPAPPPRSSTTRSARSSPHKKVDVRTWIDIITTAHRLGVPTTVDRSCTVIVETAAPRRCAISTLIRSHPARDRRLHRVRAAAASSARTRSSTSDGLVQRVAERPARPPHLRRPAGSSSAARSTTSRPRG